MKNEEKELDMKKGGIIQFEKNMAKNHPLLSQFLLSIIAAIIAGIIVVYWAANNIPPKLQAKDVPAGQTSRQVKIENLGYLPAYGVLELASDTTGISKFNIGAGEQYIELEDTEDEHIKRVVIEGLPKSEIIQINVTDSNNITIINK